MRKKKIVIICPACNKQGKYDLKNPYRPFCSERCKLIDLGQWADEEFKIPGPPLPPESEDPIH